MYIYIIYIYIYINISFLKCFLASVFFNLHPTNLHHNIMKYIHTYIYIHIYTYIYARIRI